jgi:Fe-S-cluster containining protein
MGEENDFKCLKCGTCCRNIIEIVGGIKRGLPFTENEVALFPKEPVSPKLAIGLMEPETIVLYQLNINVCPYINAKNQCQKYETRPLMCRSFPIVAGDISNRCKVFSYRKVGVVYCEPYTMAKQLEASNKLNEYISKSIKKHFQKAIKIWEYDLETKKWVFIKQYDKLPPKP